MLGNVQGQVGWHLEQLDLVLGSAPDRRVRTRWSLRSLIISCPTFGMQALLLGAHRVLVWAACSGAGHGEQDTFHG